MTNSRRVAILYLVWYPVIIHLCFAFFIFGGVLCFTIILKFFPIGAMFNFLIGERGVGKSFGMTKFLISQFLKKGEQFSKYFP